MHNFNPLPNSKKAPTFLHALGETGDRVLQIVSQVLEHPSELSKGECELVATYVSALNGCVFCKSTHGATAIALGEKEDIVEKLLEGDTSAVQKDYQPLFDFARILTEAPHSATPAHVEAILGAGWSEEAALDVLAVSSAFALMNRLVSGSGTPPLPPKALAQYAAEKAAHGYLK